MSAVISYFMTLITVSVVMALVSTLIPNGIMRAPVRMILGAIMLYTLISPIAGLAISSNAAQPQLPVSADLDGVYDDFADNMNRRVINVMRESIKEDVREYFIQTFNIVPTNISVILRTGLDKEVIVAAISMDVDAPLDTASAAALTAERYGAPDVHIREVKNNEV